MGGTTCGKRQTYRSCSIALTKYILMVIVKYIKAREVLIGGDIRVRFDIAQAKNALFGFLAITKVGQKIHVAFREAPARVAMFPSLNTYPSLLRMISYSKRNPNRGVRS